MNLYYCLFWHHLSLFNWDERPAPCCSSRQGFSSRSPSQLGKYPTALGRIDSCNLSLNGCLDWINWCDLPYLWRMLGHQESRVYSMRLCNNRFDVRDNFVVESHCCCCNWWRYWGPGSCSLNTSPLPYSVGKRMAMMPCMTLPVLLLFLVVYIYFLLIRILRTVFFFLKICYHGYWHHVLKWLYFSEILSQLREDW